MRRLKILATGGTGYLGKNLIPLLKENHDVSVLSRSGKTELKGDLLRWNAGLDIEKVKKEKFDIFLHMAGLYDLKAPTLDVFKHNIAATNMALRVSDLLEIPFFINTSSVAASVNHPLSVVKPVDLQLTKSFPDPYSESKALAEQMIINWKGRHLLKLNLRLGILVGDTLKGEISRVDGPYHAALAVDRAKSVIEAIPTELPLPGNEKVRLPLVPVDAAAKAILKLCAWIVETEERGYKSLHLTPDEGLSVLELYKSTLKHRLVRHSGIRLVNSIPETLLAKLSEFAIGFPQEQLRYVFRMPKYDLTETHKILGQNWCPEFNSYERVFWSGYEKFISHR